MTVSPHNSALIAVIAFVLGAGAVEETTTSRPTSATALPIDVAIDHPEPKFRLVGRIGKPIGELVTLQGLVVPGPFKGYEGGPNIIVQRIDGEMTQRYLRLPIAPYFGDWGAAPDGRNGPPTLTMGATFKLEGYETGGFVGIPTDAYRRAGIELQTSGHHFRSSFKVITGSRTEPVRYSPAAFVDRDALLEGVARNKGTIPVIVGSDWEIVLDGPPWPTKMVTKSAEAFGTVRKIADGSFRLESGSNSRRGLVKLEDQLDRKVTLRGTAWSMNADNTLNYRGETLDIEIEKSPAGEGWPHGDPVSVTGYLQRLAQPQRDKSDHVISYTIKRATWRRAGALLIPEIDLTNPR